MKTIFTMLFIGSVGFYLSAVNCVPAATGGGSYLSKFPQVKCYGADHLNIAIIAILMLMLLLACCRPFSLLHFEPVSRNHDYLEVCSPDFDKRMYAYRVLICVCGIVLSGSPRAQSVLLFCTSLYMFVFCVPTAPFMNRYKPLSLARLPLFCVPSTD